VDIITFPRRAYATDMHRPRLDCQLRPVMGGESS
jgi:hypothetical protein